MKTLNLKTMEEKIEQIAKTCHAIHLAFSKEMNIPTQPVWEEVEESHKNVLYDSIKKILNDEIKSVEVSHENFVLSKKKSGWVYDDVYSIENKTNPRLLSFNELT